MGAVEPGLAAIVLAGGESLRMGRSKAWLPIGAETFLQRIVRTVGEVAGEVMVVAAPNQDIPELCEAVKLVRDPVSGGGPLVGLEAGWSALTSRPERVFVSGCDSPLLTAAFVRAVVAASEGWDAAVPVRAGQRQPLAGCYTSGLLPRLSAAVARGDRSLKAFLSGLAVNELHADELSSIDPLLVSLANINTPEDWAIWRDHIERE